MIDQMFVCIKVISNILEVLLNFWLNTQKKSKNNGTSQGFKCSLVFFGLATGLSSPVTFMWVLTQTESPLDRLVFCQLSLLH